MAKRTWAEMDELTTAKVKRYKYDVDFVTLNGNVIGYEEEAISPTMVYEQRLRKRYDATKFAWFVRELQSAAGANVVVTKISGLRKTKHYYFIEVVPKNVYEARMQAYREHENNQRRWSSY